MEAMKDLSLAPRPGGATILDWLNEDCWRLVLGYVPVEDIMRSELISRQWQAVVHRYLQDVGLRLQRYDHRFCKRQRAGRKIIIIKGRSEAMDHSSGLMRHMGFGGLEKTSVWTEIVKKWGEYIVACECSKPEKLKLVVRHCPNLEELMVAGIDSDKVKKKTFHFKKLRRLSFQFCDPLSESFVSRFLVNTTLEELVFDRNIPGITGVCLTDFKSELKCVHFNCSFGFEFDYLLKSDRISNLTKLDLSEDGVKVLKNLHLLLEKTPNLECLYLDWYNDMETDHKVLLEAISGLRRLKHISLMSNSNVRDSWLEALGRCPQLRSVDVSVCQGANAGWVSVSLEGLARELAAARARGALPPGLRLRLHGEKQWRRALSTLAKDVAKQLDFVDLQYYPEAIVCYPWMQEMRTSKRR